MLSSLFLLAVAAALPAKPEISIPGKPTMEIQGGDPQTYHWNNGKLDGYFDNDQNYHWYGLNNNCRVLNWGGAWNTPDGSHKKNALVECILEQKSVAHDVRTLGEPVNCPDGIAKEVTCRLEHTESETTSEGVDIGFDLEGFSMSAKTSYSKTTSDTEESTFKLTCTKPGRQCAIGGKALIEYDMYIGWVHWDSWRYPDEGKGPQWINADNDDRGMWDFREYKKYNYDPVKATGWYKWAGSDDDCEVQGQRGDYASKCQQEF
ncbi:hypothetical protein DICA1_A01816 [Diutina catenulata]